MNRKIKVIIADDLESYRDGIRVFLQMEGMEIIGEAINGKHLMELLKVNKLEPDVILLDIDMPEMDGGEALVEIRKFDPNIKVIVLTLIKNEDLARDFKEKGANCFFTKDVGIRWVVDAINNLVRDVKHTNIKKNVKPIFTKVEIEIIHLIVEHKNAQQIAKIRGKSIKSIEAHKKKIYEKAGVSTATEFNSFCSSGGLKFLGQKN